MLQQIKPNLTDISNPQHLKAISEEHFRAFLSLYELSPEEEILVRTVTKSAITMLLKKRGG